MSNPLLGGLASASYCVPYRRVRGWSRQISWLTCGAFSWLVAPRLFALLRTHDLFGVLAATPSAHTDSGFSGPAVSRFLDRDHRIGKRDEMNG
jgi:hypothetical protein